MISSQIPVILDTDIGGDIDDALCLAYLLRQPKCDLLGITTVSGDTITRAKLASCICQRVKRDDIPIYAGAPMPLIGPQLQVKVPQATALEQWSHKQDFSENSALIYLRDTIRSRPGEISLLTIGPLTNIGLLFSLYPDVAKKLKRLVSMCGCYYDKEQPRLNEWNAKVDYTATDIVYRTAVKEHMSVGFDVTRQCVISGDEARKMIRGGVLDPVADMASVWLKEAGNVTFHDPLTAALLFEPSLCGMKRGECTVDASSTPTGGVTNWHESSRGRHTVAATVDSKRFLDHYFSVTKG